MRDRDSTRPFVFFFLVLPYGISSGFVSINLPFLLTRVGFSVAQAASNRSHRRVGKPLAISLGTGGRPDFDRAPLGNLPVVYMTASDGWVHDRFGTAWMLHSEALIAILGTVLALAVLRWINPPRRFDLVLS